MYYDERDYYNSENIDELYDNSDDDSVDEYDSESEWEFDYHNIAEELIDE